LLRRTHVLFGSAVAATAAATMRLDTLCYAALLAGSLWGSVAPDADLRRRHRMLLHNVWPPLLLSLGALLLPRGLELLGVLARLFLLGAALGWAGHILLDSLTAAGVALLYPMSRRRVRLAWLRSGGLGDAVVSVVSFIVYVVATARVVGVAP